MKIELNKIIITTYLLNSLIIFPLNAIAQQPVTESTHPLMELDPS
jgi:hypothetical protein